MENTSAFIERANEIVCLKELTKTSYEDAVKRAVEAASRATSAHKRARELSALAKSLAQLAYTYANEHPTALTEPLHALTGKTQAGEVVFDDGSVFSLTVGVADPKRIDGSNITEAFKQTLPKGWVKTKLDLHIDAIKSASADEREEHGLVCQPLPLWKRVIS